MSLPAPAADAATLPVALVSVTLAGQCRERSPADILLFGEEGIRFAERFADPDAGRTLLAAAIRDGTAETVAELVLDTGHAPFRVSLWRQRGGDRIRVVGAFVPGVPRRTEGPAHRAPPDHPAALSAGASAGGFPAIAPLVRLWHDLCSPVGAVMGLAERLRAEAGSIAGEPASLRGYASDFLAAAWRMRRIAEEIGVLATEGCGADPRRVSEIDLGRLARRILRLVRPAADARGVRLAVAGPDRGDAAVVMSDEGALWSALDNLLRHALRIAPPESEIHVSIPAPDPAGRLSLDVALVLPGNGGPELGTGGCELSVAAEMVRAAGGEVELSGPPGRSFAARITFPPERCLSEP